MATWYADLVSMARAIAASTVPRAMKTFITTRSRARMASRSAAVKDSAIIVVRAVRCMACPQTATLATTTNAAGVRANR